MLLYNPLYYGHTDIPVEDVKTHDVWEEWGICAICMYVDLYAMFKGG